MVSPALGKGSESLLHPRSHPSVSQPHGDGMKSGVNFAEKVQRQMTLELRSKASLQCLSPQLVTTTAPQMPKVTLPSPMCAKPCHIPNQGGTRVGAVGASHTLGVPPPDFRAASGRAQGIHHGALLSLGRQAKPRLCSCSQICLCPQLTYLGGENSDLPWQL